MLPSILASSIAARACGYPSIADLILADQLGPRAIARLFANGISRDHGKVLAVVLLAGSTARFNSCRQGWNGDLERDLAIKALGGEAGFVAANKQAVALVQSHWAEISAPGGVLTKKTQETRVRRLAAKYGYRLRKARWAVGAHNAGAYMLGIIRSNRCVLGARYDVTLDEIERWLRAKDTVERPPPRLGIGSY